LLTTLLPVMFSFVTARIVVSVLVLLAAGYASGEKNRGRELSDALMTAIVRCRGGDERSTQAGETPLDARQLAPFRLAAELS
jgi:hypothetical protein